MYRHGGNILHADEHQDANQSQNRLLELLSSFHDNPNLFIVGDEKQAIFRFQGASFDNFLYFKERHKKALLVRLVENYRSTQAILDAAHSLIVKGATPDPSLRVKLNSQKGRGAPVRVSALPDDETEAAFIARNASPWARFTVCAAFRKSFQSFLPGA